MSYIDLVCEYDELVRTAFPKIIYPLDQVCLWMDTGHTPRAITLVYRSHTKVRDDKYTMWCYTPINDNDQVRVQFVHSHAAMLKLVQPSVGICYTYSNLLGKHLRLLSAAPYKLQIERERITGRMINKAVGGK